MMPYLAGFVGNPSSIHSFGRRARQAVETARREVARLVGASDRTLVFTSGGTEANNAAITGAFLAANEMGESSGSLQRAHVVVSAIEHHAVLHACQELSRLGARLTLVAPDSEGRLSPEAIVNALQADTAIVAVMAVNNELGTVQPVDVIAALVKQVRPDIHVHADMVQALGAIRLRMDASHIDTAAFSAHKVHGPQGVGALYIRPDARWHRTAHGGNQERNRRAGTENVAGIVGFGVACRQLREEWDQRVNHQLVLRDRLWELLSTIPGVRRNTPLCDTAPGILNLGFGGVRNDRLLMRLDLEGIAASAGSACTAGSLEPSHVLLACGQRESEVLEAIRFSVSHQNTLEEVVQVAGAVRSLIDELRASG